ncbi:phenylalanine--tRNA ligase subunit alpha [Rhodohalobacter sulfatireducens]|uniref:Phenylalanine--tRNA ligase alpha subunit n=1 Tax=Rhodohalobacter sulfatireducens TaxID=2911366 RepID=A0ABS9KGS3_9BACT|nr:phenylalanine--tRNA ligase subunit alpha [Rhodohalobacter sulfatireducens]MCG2590017.1 phenylalanine--tRNA ligase subunit alpha [Rhodohalobacter sulfatireducens]
MLDKINDIKEKIQSFSIENEDELEAFRLEFLSRNGKVQSMFGLMKDVPNEKKAEVGKLMNEVKNLAHQTFENAKVELLKSEEKEFGALEDITLPVESTYTGSYHPLNRALNEIKQIFLRLGFNIADGPELEDDFHNFTALNFPPDHPARDMQDTFFVRKSEEEQDLVLRTHTSPVQIRLMKEKEPPLRSIIPGRVFRNEAVTAKSYFQFNQVEGLYVNVRVTMGELIETLVMFAQLMYGSDVKYRVRPSYFPFTEPSIEMDVWWESEKGGQWLEILGAGMVDPNVFESVDVDSEKYTGFAFGMGVDRIAMLRYGIDDIRLLYDNDIRFLEQFKS